MAHGPTDGLPEGGWFLRALEVLRDDVREDIRHLRDDVREDNARIEGRVTGMMEAFARAHATEHIEDRIVLEKDLGELKAWKRAEEIATARREGALGLLRFGLELLSRHAKPIVAVILATAGGLLALSGKVDISVGIR